MKNNKFSNIVGLSFLLVTLTIIFRSTIISQIINVPGDQPTIQAAINSSDNGDTVLVSPNTYFENINFNGKGIVVASHFILDQDYSFIISTIIDGSNPAHPDTASCVRFISGEDSSSTLIGFTITGGTGTIWPDIHIGGKFREGGGILIELSSPTIKSNLIIDNEAVDKSPGNVASAGGGAIRCGDGNPKIINNVIRGNRGLYGAGIVLNYSGGIIKNNIIYQNTGGQDFGGSGIWCYNNFTSPKIIENNTIVENSSTGSGLYGGKGGAMMVWSTSVTARNNIIRNNTQSSGGPIASISATPNVTYSNINGGYTGEGNIDINPSFADTNLTLRSSSQCVDNGDPNPEFNDLEDPTNLGFAMYPAKGTTRNDMGAYGGPLTALLGGTIITDISETENLPTSFVLEQNYPNPFNPVTKIKYSIPQNVGNEDFRSVQLMIYDVLGNEIATLVDEQSAIVGPGIYEAEFDGTSLSSGIYFYKLTYGEHSLTRKMVLMK